MGGFSVSIDLLQEKIRKTKNPSVIVFDAFSDSVPPQLLQEGGSAPEGFRLLCSALLSGLKGTVGAVRFGFSSFAAWGSDGIAVLSMLLKEAREQGYYVLLDLPEMLSQMAARNMADALSPEDTPYPCDGVVISAFLGSDVLKPFIPLTKKGKSVFAVVRTANKSATEIQDLLTGTRLVHTAASDVVCRLGESAVGKCGYSQVGVLAAASNADSLRSLRGKYSRMFLLLDGFDYPNANAKNCSFAFDKLGHGSAACAGTSVTAAWKSAQDQSDYVSAAVEAAQRMKKNLTRYVSVL